jgi:hypothetical protein
MFQKSLRRQRLRQDTSAWTSGGPAKGRSVAAFLGRWRALPLRGPPRGQRFFFFFSRDLFDFVFSKEIRKTDRGGKARRHQITKLSVQPRAQIILDLPVL